jgi:hypothetical protein
MQQVVDANGVLQVVEREEKGFHYSWIPTKEYRTRFGYLAFSRSRGSSVSLVRADGARLIPSDNAAVVYDPKRAQLCALPEVLLHAGTTMVSGLVHTLAAGFLWHRSLDWTHLPDWPAESGGTGTIQRIADRCRLLMADRSKEERLTFDEWSASKDAREREDIHLTCVDLPLYRLLEPEKRREQRLMVKAMHRVFDIIFI